MTQVYSAMIYFIYQAILVVHQRSYNRYDLMCQMDVWHDSSAPMKIQCHNLNITIHLFRFHHDHYSHQGEDPIVMPIFKMLLILSLQR